MGWKGGQGPGWEQGAALARRCQRPGAHGGGPGGRAQVGAEPRARAAPQRLPHSPPPQNGHPAPQLAARHRAPRLRRTVPGHGGRRAQRGPGCGQKRTAIAKGPPPVGHTDTGRDMRGHARMHTDHSHRERPHGGGRDQRENRHKQRDKHRERGDMRQSPVCHSAPGLSHWEGSQSHLTTSHCHTPASHCLITSSRRELTTLQGVSPHSENPKVKGGGTAHLPVTSPQLETLTLCPWPPAVTCFGAGKADTAQLVAVTSPGWAVPRLRASEMPITGCTRNSSTETLSSVTASACSPRMESDSGERT